MNKIFNPFNKIAGLKALLYGIPLIFLTALIAYFSHTRFDGVIDIHYSSENLFNDHLIEGLLNWISLSIVFYIIGVSISGRSVRLIDVAGTMSLARFPLFFSALVGFAMQHNKVADYISWKLLHIGDEVTIHIGDLLLFVIAFLIVILTLIWVIALMYNAFRVSTNVKGTRAVIWFIIGLLISEIFVKYILFTTGKLTLVFHL